MRCSKCGAQNRETAKFGGECAAPLASRDEGCAMLAEIYNWFTEGFDTADLKDASALVDELST
jgi:hypothetical protein